MTTPCTTDLCIQFVAQNNFQLQPESYCKDYPKWPGAVGLEIEMQPLHATAGVDIPTVVVTQGAGKTLASALKLYANKNRFKTTEDEGLLTLVKLDDHDFLTFEPGGQLELSTRPYPCLGDALQRADNVQADLRNFLQTQGIELIQFGFNPWHSIEQISLQMTKPRYQAMDRFFSHFYPYGQNMMRQTSTIQVCLDFGQSEETLVKRYLTAQMLAPFACGLFAFSPFLHGSDSGHKSYRSLIWRHMDPTRSGLSGLAQNLKYRSQKSCIEQYVKFALGAHVVFVQQLDYFVPPQLTTFAEWMEQGIEGVYPTSDDFALHLTLLFPEVRPKGFLEIRSIDCQAHVWQAAPAAFFTGLLYDDTALNYAFEWLVTRAEKIPELLVQSTHGLDHPDIASGAKELMGQALKGFDRLPSCFNTNATKLCLHKFAEQFTFRGRSPADDWLDIVKKQNNQQSLAVFSKLEDNWRNLFN